MYLPVLGVLRPHTFYAGGHPTSFLTDDNHKGFTIAVELELYSIRSGSGYTDFILSPVDLASPLDSTRAMTTSTSVIFIVGASG